MSRSAQREGTPTTAHLARELAVRRLDWIVPAWNGPAQVEALFTTRNGGASVGAAATLDVGPAQLNAADRDGAIAENRRRLRALLPADPVWLAQVHGRDVVEIDERAVGRMHAIPPTADAAVTRTPGVVLSVRTADCLPVLFADRAGSVVAVAHAGWRGLAAGVLEATIAAMRVPAADVHAWLGPAIGPRAFEVGPDVYAAYCDTDPGATDCFSMLRAQKWLADLPGLARRRLAASGVHDVAVDGSCTFTDCDRFFSYRRDKRSGRMALLAWLRPSEREA
jgi:YfiH family protein